MTETASDPNEVEQKRLDLVHNERAKLTATWLNNLGVGSIVAGFIAPSLTLIASDTSRLLVGLAAAIIWILIGMALHSMGRSVLKGLKL